MFCSEELTVGKLEKLVSEYNFFGRNSKCLISEHLIPSNFPIILDHSYTFPLKKICLSKNLPCPKICVHSAFVKDLRLLID